MKAPLSWIRAYVDLPDDVTPADLAHRLTALGLKLEALESPGSDLVGPVVVGRVLSMEPEPQKNGKTINWCQVDCGPEHGEHGIVCGAHNFAPGDLVVVSLPGATLPGGFEIAARKTYGHVSDGMICSTKELGTGEDHGGILVLDPRIDGDVAPGDDAIDLLGLRDDVIEFEINPDRAYALSLRGIAREAAIAYDVPFHDPAERDVPAPNDAGYPVRLDAPDGCPVFVTRTVTGFDPAAPTPRHIARRIQLAGMRPISLGVDVTNYVMLELGQPLHGYDGDKLAGPIVVRRATRGREDHHARRRAPQPVGRGPADHRRQRPDRHRRRDGRPDHRAVGDLVDGGDRGRALRADHDLPQRAPAQAALRGVQALRARRRPAAPGVRRGPGRAAARRARRRHRDRRRDVRRDAARAAADHRPRRPARADHRHGDRRRTPPSRTCARSAARSPPTAPR